MQFLVLVAYNFRLERSFLMDEGAMPPNPASGRFSEDTTPNTSKDTEDDASRELVLAPPPRPTDPLYNVASFVNDSQLVVNTAVARDLTYASFVSELKETVLFSSPFLTNELPYLLTEEGSKSGLRRFFPRELYSAHHDAYSIGDDVDCFTDKKMMHGLRANPKLPDSEYHPFITAKVRLLAFLAVVILTLIFIMASSLFFGLWSFTQKYRRFPWNIFIFVLIK